MLIKKKQKNQTSKQKKEVVILSKTKLLNLVNWEKINGLVPVVTQDYKTGKVLMLGFMNKEALKKTLNDGKVIYWSRTRKKLWTKGETSGHFQLVKGIWLDCDNDTFLIKVRQTGNICHTGRKTCFFQKILWRIPKK